MAALLPMLLAKRNCFAKTETDLAKLLSFIIKIQDGYKNITYHNKTHGADLCQTMNYFMIKGEMEDKLKIDALEMVGIFTAACMHDFEHPGVNNDFLIKMQDPIAIRHNDQSVLENHHIAASFEIMLGDPQNNWAFKFEPADFKRLRSLMIDCVLATDMSYHFKEIGHFKTRIASEDFKPEDGPDKNMTIKMFFHLADISNPIKKWELCRDWTELLYLEFFAQGDLEV